MNFAMPLSAHTFVNAAVKVVFPWSTCPIVPMLTCGFFRSNFAFAILPPSTQTQSDVTRRDTWRRFHQRFAWEPDRSDQTPCCRSHAPECETASRWHTRTFHSTAQRPQWPER